MLGRVLQEFLPFCDIFLLCLPLKLSPTVSSHFAVQIHHHWWWVRNIIHVQKGQCAITFIWKRKEASVTRHAELRAVKQICQPRMSAQRITVVWQVMNEWCSCPQAPSRERERERLNWKMILAIMVGKSDRTQIPLLTLAGLGLDLWDVQYRDEKNHLPYSFCLFEMKICSEQDFWFKSEALWIQRKGPAKCSPFQWWLEMGIEKMAPSFWPHHRKSGLPS